MIVNNKRKCLDLYFLLNLPKEQVHSGVIKRLEMQGQGPKVDDIKIPCDIYMTYQKFNYQGNTILQIYRMKVRNVFTNPTQNFPYGVFLALKSMRKHQRSWFNIAGSLNFTANLPYEGGSHFYITINEIRYKNDDNIQSKRLVVLQNKQEGRNLFFNGKYQEALQKYRYIANITQKQPKINKKNQIEELKQMNLNGKINFLRCFAKLKVKDAKTLNSAEEFSQQVTKIFGQTELSLFLKAHVQMRTKYLSDGLDTAKKLYKLNQEQGGRMIKLITEQIRKN